MDLKLKRDHFLSDGIFGELTYKSPSNNDILLAMTCEHAYDSGHGDGSYKPKLQPGVYTCVRGKHKLHNSPEFETFEITGVKGHTGILFHVGNFNEDSDGCVLLGRNLIPSGTGQMMITSSKNTFNKFLDLERNINEFTLTVI